MQFNYERLFFSYLMGNLHAICNGIYVCTVYEFFEIVFRNKINAIPLGHCNINGNMLQNQ